MQITTPQKKIETTNEPTKEKQKRKRKKTKPKNELEEEPKKN